MEIVLDSSILIASERRGISVESTLDRLRQRQGNATVSISAITVVELTHGIYRARTEADRERRNVFVAEVLRYIPVQALSTEIAQIAGRIEGEQAAQGNSIPFEDLLIGATAMFLGGSVATLNPKDFNRIPGLHVIAL